MNTSITFINSNRWHLFPIFLKLSSGSVSIFFKEKVVKNSNFC